MPLSERRPAYFACSAINLYVAMAIISAISAHPADAERKAA
jgi:hypothetical protein